MAPGATRSRPVRRPAGSERPHFMYLVDCLLPERNQVILDWVPAHSNRRHRLGYFDGTHLYEHADPRQGKQREWNTLLYNFGCAEVRNFMTSNALFWLEKYHRRAASGRGGVDAYLDYGKSPAVDSNRFGGRENLDAIDFLRRLKASLCRNWRSPLPRVHRVANGVSQLARWTWVRFQVEHGLDARHAEYMSKDPVYRSFHHNKILFSLMYAFSENFILPLSHDEVVYGKAR